MKRIITNNYVLKSKILTAVFIKEVMTTSKDLLEAFRSSYAIK